MSTRRPAQQPAKPTPPQAAPSETPQAAPPPVEAPKPHVPRPAIKVALLGESKSGKSALVLPFVSGESAASAVVLESSGSQGFKFCKVTRFAPTSTLALVTALRNAASSPRIKTVVLDDVDYMIRDFTRVPGVEIRDAYRNFLTAFEPALNALLRSNKNVFMTMKARMTEQITDTGMKEVRYGPFLSMVTEAVLAGVVDLVVHVFRDASGKRYFVTDEASRSVKGAMHKWYAGRRVGMVLPDRVDMGNREPDGSCMALRNTLVTFFKSFDPGTDAGLLSELTKQTEPDDGREDLPADDDTLSAGQVDI